MNGYIKTYDENAQPLFKSRQTQWKSQLSVYLLYIHNYTMSHKLENSVTKIMRITNLYMKRNVILHKTSSSFNIHKYGQICETD